MDRIVIAAVDDMFFASKIRAVADHLGVTVKFVRSNEAAIEAAQNASVALIVVDLQSQKVRAVELGQQLKSDERLYSLPLIGFFSHVETALQQSALEAGYDRVLPRSAFSKDLAEILGGSQ